MIVPYVHHIGVRNYGTLTICTRIILHSSIRIISSVEYLLTCDDVICAGYETIRTISTRL